MINRRQFSQSLAAASLLGSSALQAQARSLSFVGWSHDEAASKPTLTAMFEGYRKANADVKLDVIGFPWGQMQSSITGNSPNGPKLPERSHRGVDTI